MAGRKSKCDDWIQGDGLILVRGWCRDGLTEEQIAHNIGISVTTLNSWKRRFPSFLKAIKESKEVADRIVENALYKNATGYEYEEEEYTTYPDGSMKHIIKKKEARPDKTAQIFWLKNRKPEQWRDQKNIQMDGNIKTSPYEDLTTEELRKLIGSDPNE